MRNAFVGVKRRDLLQQALESNGLTLAYLPLHGSVSGTDTTAEVVQRDPQLLLGGSVPIQGTTAGAWANAGWWTPAANSFINRATADAVKLFDTSASACLMIAFDLWHTGDPSTEIQVLESGVNNSASGNGGGFGIRMTTAGLLQCVGRAPDTGSSVGWVASRDLTTLTSQRISSAFMVDLSAKTVTHLSQGATWTTSAATGDPEVRFAPPANWGVTIGARRESTAASYTRYLGSGGNGVRVANLWILNDASGIILNNHEAIAADMALRPNHVSRELLRLLGL